MSRRGKVAGWGLGKGKRELGEACRVGQLGCPIRGEEKEGIEGRKEESRAARFGAGVVWGEEVGSPACRLYVGCVAKENKSSTLNREQSLRSPEQTARAHSPTPKPGVGATAAEDSAVCGG